MRKLVVYELVSLDGVAEYPDQFLGWDDAMDAHLAAVIATQDAEILAGVATTNGLHMGPLARWSRSRR
jgi:hypothetical protein